MSDLLPIPLPMPESIAGAFPVWRTAIHHLPFSPVRTEMVYAFVRASDILMDASPDSIRERIERLKEEVLAQYLPGGRLADCVTLRLAVSAVDRLEKLLASAASGKLDGRGNPGQGDVQWSNPATLQKWANIFDIGLNAMRSIIAEKKIQSRELAKGSISIALSDLPALERAKYPPFKQ